MLRHDAFKADLKRLVDGFCADLAALSLRYDDLPAGFRAEAIDEVLGRAGRADGGAA